MLCPKCRFDNPENTKFCGICASPHILSEEFVQAQTETLAITIHDIMRRRVLGERYEIIEGIDIGWMSNVNKAYHSLREGPRFREILCTEKRKCDKKKKVSPSLILIKNIKNFWVF
jgi:hypothetical protein